jgi:hypothetical protein
LTFPRVGSMPEAVLLFHTSESHPSVSGREQPNATLTKLIIKVDGCLTDPEPGMDSRRATVRNVRSKCRCSCVLQFTFRRAVSCVLHRPPSQVIHCIVLSFYVKVRSSRGRRTVEKEDKITSLHGEVGLTEPGQGRKLLGRFDISSRPN